MKTNFAIILYLSFSFAEINFSYNGEFTQFYSQRTSNNKVLNIPFNMIDLHTRIQIENFGIKSYITSEYHQTYDNYLHSNNITNSIRELYGTFYFDLGEISIGKKIFTLGSVDENSPIDHFNPYNYYYLLTGGIDKKIGINVLSFDFYFDNDYIISGAISPDHNINHYPENDPEYELSLPINPSKYDFMNVKGSDHESFLSVKKSNMNNEFTITYARAFDRVFSLSGLVSFFNDNGIAPITENKFSYRLTESLNFGNIFLLDDLTIRSDFSLFHSFDRNNLNEYINLISKADKIMCESEIPGIICDPAPIYNGNLNGEDDMPFALPLNENVYYSQMNIQIELPLPNYWQVNLQFFKFTLEKYSSTNYLTDDIELPLAQISSGGFFSPGFGSSMATLSTKTILFSIEKSMLDNNLKSTFSSFFDLDKGDGKLFSFELEYEFFNNIIFIFGSTKIYGDSSVQSNSDYDLGYTFNLMEDFSHNRIQLSYFF